MKSMFTLLLLVSLAWGKPHRHRVPWHPVFPPSRASLLAQNAEIDALGLERIQDDAQLSGLIERHALLSIEETKFLKLGRIPENRRYCRPWTRNFLEDLSLNFYMEFARPLILTSAVRTVRVQRRLLRWNKNAAPAHGETASSHLAGTAVDISWRGLTRDQILWLENYLTEIKDSVIVEEERRQPCFHIMVRVTYSRGENEHR